MSVAKRELYNYMEQTSGKRHVSPWSEESVRKPKRLLDKCKVLCDGVDTLALWYYVQHRCCNLLPAATIMRMLQS